MDRDALALVIELGVGVGVQPEGPGGIGDDGGLVVHVDAAGDGDAVVGDAG